MFCRALQRCSRLSASLNAQCNLRRSFGNIEVDVSNLKIRPFFDPVSEETTKSTSVMAKEPLSPLAKEIYQLIQHRGPITLHDYMLQVIGHQHHGYYRQATNIIGAEGDFVTSPEISQLFGETIAIWLIYVWELMNTPFVINLVEFGPGKGTMMKDILRVVDRFPKFRKSLHIHMVELSDNLRDVQFEALGCQERNFDFQTNILRGKTSSGIPISWYRFVDEVPKGPSLFIAQEFLDTFPVHQFYYTANGWREKLVDIDTSEDSPYNFRLVLAPSQTPAVKAIMESTGRIARHMAGQIKTMQAMSPEEQKLNASSLETQLISDADKKNLKVGDGIEISPLALATCEDIAIRVRDHGGAALFIDYGEAFTQEDTIRSFRKHNQVSIFSDPGNCDITVDVDFAACKKVGIQKGVHASEIIGQGQFLMNMQVADRLEKLIASDDVTDEQAVTLYNAFEYLVSDDKMGKRFKVVSFYDKSIEVPGFPPSTPSTSSV